VYRAADRADRSADDAGTMATTSGSTTILMVGFVSLPRRRAFVQQRLMLGGVASASVIDGPDA
jgi:hypothetical protein